MFLDIIFIIGGLVDSCWWDEEKEGKRANMLLFIYSKDELSDGIGSPHSNRPGKYYSWEIISIIPSLGIHTFLGMRLWSEFPGSSNLTHGWEKPDSEVSIEKSILVFRTWNTLLHNAFHRDGCCLDSK